MIDVSEEGHAILAYEVGFSNSQCQQLLAPESLSFPHHLFLHGRSMMAVGRMVAASLLTMGCAIRARAKTQALGLTIDLCGLIGLKGLRHVLQGLAYGSASIGSVLLHFIDTLLPTILFPFTAKRNRGISLLETQSSSADGRTIHTTNHQETANDQSLHCRFPFKSQPS